MTINNPLFVLLSAAVLFTPAFGQRAGTPPDSQTMIQMRVARLTSQLGLSDAQKTSATAIFTDAAAASQTIQSSLSTNRQALSAAVKKNDTAAIDQLSATEGALSGQLTAIRTKADAAFYAILTADQQTKYDSLLHGGPGAMGMARRGR
jgi:Spy/CpxP family protein refolding chaperone